MKKYVLFCKVFNEQMDLFDGDRDSAAYTTLKIMRSPDLLAEYWEKHRNEINYLVEQMGA